MWLWPMAGVDDLNRLLVDGIACVAKARGSIFNKKKKQRFRGWRSGEPLRASFESEGSASPGATRLRVPPHRHRFTASPRHVDLFLATRNSVFGARSGGHFEYRHALTRAMDMPSAMPRCQQRRQTPWARLYRRVASERSLMRRALRSLQTYARTRCSLSACPENVKKNSVGLSTAWLTSVEPNERWPNAVSAAFLSSAGIKVGARLAVGDVQRIHDGSQPGL